MITAAFVSITLFLFVLFGVLAYLPPKTLNRLQVSPTIQWYILFAGICSLALSWLSAIATNDDIGKLKYAGLIKDSRAFYSRGLLISHVTTDSVSFFVHGNVGRVGDSTYLVKTGIGRGYQNFVTQDRVSFSIINDEVAPLGKTPATNKSLPK
jgi:hypothetical protein